MSRKGLVIIYYGDGKGKTTAAMGLAARALGRGLKVHIIQFMKGTWTTGEMESLQRLGAGFEQMGKGFYKMMDDKLPVEEHMNAARRGLERAFEIIRNSNISSPSVIQDVDTELKRKNQNQEGLRSVGVLDARLRGHDGNILDVLILDESIRAVQDGLLSQDDICQLIDSKPPGLHLVMTGHTVWQALLDRADVVSEMKKIKHPFDRGVLAHIGVDF